jgi:hypothetical protein
VVAEHLELVELDAGNAGRSGEAVEEQLVAHGARSQEESTLTATARTHHDFASLNEPWASHRDGTPRQRWKRLHVWTRRDDSEGRTVGQTEQGFVQARLTKKPRDSGETGGGETAGGPRVGHGRGHWASRGNSVETTPGRDTRGAYEVGNASAYRHENGNTISRVR